MYGFLYFLVMLAINIITSLLYCKMKFMETSEKSEDKILWEFLLPEFSKLGDGDNSMYYFMLLYLVLGLIALGETYFYNI